jgi:hypothetical protein
MAVDAARHVRRGRLEGDRLAKERRQKIILAVGLLLLLVLLAIQLPGLVGGLRGGSSESATALPSIPVHGQADSAAVTQKRFRERVAALEAFPAADPFVPQIATSSPARVRLGSRGAPDVRTKRFVVKDPFENQVVSQPAPRLIAHAKPRATRATGGGGAYMVVLASIPLPRGMDAAERLAQTARSRGLTGAGVLTSASYPALRAGFYVVYSGTYKSMDAAVQGLEIARAHGFSSAYPRQLKG